MWSICEGEQRGRGGSPGPQAAQTASERGVPAFSTAFMPHSAQIRGNTSYPFEILSRYGDRLHLWASFTKNISKGPAACSSVSHISASERLLQVAWNIERITSFCKLTRAKLSHVLRTDEVSDLLIRPPSCSLVWSMIQNNPPHPSV